MQAEDHDQILKGRRVLVVEDQFLIADDMRRAVVRLGGEVMGPVGQVAAAAALARTSGRPDLALLDINLHGESVYDFADEMRAQEVPVILATGYGRPDIRPDFADVVRLEKPVTLEALIAAIHRVGVLS